MEVGSTTPEGPIVRFETIKSNAKRVKSVTTARRGGSAGSIFPLSWASMRVLKLKLAEHGQREGRWEKVCRPNQSRVRSL